MIHVVVVDDHPAFCEGVTTILTTDHDIKVVGQVRSAEAAFRAVEDLAPDVCLVDIRLPGIDGVEACGLLRQRHPALRLLVLSGYHDECLVFRAFAAGADGFLNKEVEPNLLRQAVRIVHEGGTLIDPQIAGRLVARVTKHRRVPGTQRRLTHQELQVLTYLPGGSTNREIAAALGVSHETVKTHLQNAMRKLGVSDRSEAVAVVRRDGLV